MCKPSSSDAQQQLLHQAAGVLAFLKEHQFEDAASKLKKQLRRDFGKKSIPKQCNGKWVWMELEESSFKEQEPETDDAVLIPAQSATTTEAPAIPEKPKNRKSLKKKKRKSTKGASTHGNEAETTEVACEQDQPWPTVIMAPVLERRESEERRRLSDLAFLDRILDSCSHLDVELLEEDSSSPASSSHSRDEATCSNAEIDDSSFVSDDDEATEFASSDEDTHYTAHNRGIKRVTFAAATVHEIDNVLINLTETELAEVYYSREELQSIRRDRDTEIELIRMGYISDLLEDEEEEETGNVEALSLAVWGSDDSDSSEEEPATDDLPSSTDSVAQPDSSTEARRRGCRKVRFADESETQVHFIPKPRRDEYKALFFSKFELQRFKIDRDAENLQALISNVTQSLTASPSSSAKKGVTNLNSFRSAQAA